MAAGSVREEKPRKKKFAFVTVGASASFKPLIEEIISEPFIAKLKSLHFSHLVVQCGPDYDYFESAKPRDSDGLKIEGFAYDKDLQRWMSFAAECGPDGDNECEKGLIITHAGSGSILDALDFNTNIIAVPNTSLMDNHQVEIAEEMEAQGFLIQGKIGSLADLVTEDILNAPRKQWPPEPDPRSTYPGGLWEVIDSLMPTRELRDSWWF
ncbi:glycosyltransferase family 1 protein [Hypoxylon trugodes]|uniref:glycosyltransferase family 1 protein n=1 Tax=Hypoxylon trugodes TaxID=326681 RepID=UPI00219188CF|nr:glycosyltransferase family 1 protein [Hypoxylon trugodes]KAI1389840.1 glycosyltransferase family 1 protein [Hypoxylon trugodes]